MESAKNAPNFEKLKNPANDIFDLLSKLGTPKKIVLPMANRDDFLVTLRSFEAFDGWAEAGDQWTTDVVYEHSLGQAPLVRHVDGAELHFLEPPKAHTGLAKLRRVRVDRSVAFRLRGWEYAFRCRWTAATLSPGIESLVEQRAAPTEYAVVIDRRDWDVYAAENTRRHVAESIGMKVDDIRAIIFSAFK